MSEHKVKRFVFMGGDIYYASGGFRDYRGSYDTKEEAEARMQEFLEVEGWGVWAHVADLETGEYWGNGKAYAPMAMLRS